MKVLLLISLLCTACWPQPGKGTEKLSPDESEHAAADFSADMNPINALFIINQ